MRCMWKIDSHWHMHYLRWMYTKICTISYSMKPSHRSPQLHQLQVPMHRMDSVIHPLLVSHWTYVHVACYTVEHAPPRDGSYTACVARLCVDLVFMSVCVVYSDRDRFHHIDCCHRVGCCTSLLSQVTPFRTTVGR